MSVPGTKKSWVNLVPGFPSLARSVMTEALLLSSVAACELSALLAPATPRRRSRHRLPRRQACPAAGGPPPPKRRACRRRGGLRGGRRDGARDDDVGPDRPERRKDAVLGVGESLRDPDDAHHEPDPCGESKAVTSVRPQRRRSSFQA